MFLLKCLNDSDVTNANRFEVNYSQLCLVDDTIGSERVIICRRLMKAPDYPSKNVVLIEGLLRTKMVVFIEKSFNRHDIGLLNSRIIVNSDNNANQLVIHT